MKKHTAQSLKRSRRERIQNAREKKAEKKASSSSTEESKVKREKKDSGDDIDLVMKRLSEEMAKAMTATEDRNELERKLDLAQFQLDEAKQRVKKWRDKSVATTKRENRLRDAKSSQQEQEKLIDTAYGDCSSYERSKRITECITVIRQMIGVDEKSEKYTESRDGILRDILGKLEAKTKFTVEEDLQFTILFNLPDHSRECIKQFMRNRLLCDPFATNATVRYCRKELSDTSKWKYEEFADKTGCADGSKGRQPAFAFYDPEIETSIHKIIQSQTKSQKLNLDEPYNDVLTLVLMLDKGGSLTKLGFSISNLIEKVGSPSNFTLIGLSSLSENYENMRLAFGRIFEIIHQMNGSSLTTMSNGKERVLTIRFKVGGDFKSIAMLMGQSGACSKYYCPICIATKTTMNGWDVTKEHPIRGTYVLGQFNISKPPLIPSIAATDIVLPVNHTLTGVVKKAFATLAKKLGAEATEWSDEKEEQLTGISKSLCIAIDNLEQIRSLKKKILDIHAATSQVDSFNRNITEEICSDYCVIDYINSAPTDTIPCDNCEHSNHTICARLEYGDIMRTHHNYGCFDCRSETKESLLRKDKVHLETLEEEESELLDIIQSLETEREELLREQGRTSEKLQSELEQLKISCGVYNRHYYADLIGEDARRLTRPENAARLWNLVDDDKVRNTGIQLFAAIHEIFSLLHTGYSTPAEIDQFMDCLQRIQTHWTDLNPVESITLKLHSFVHMAQAMRREGHAGREIEVVEHAHHILNVLLPKYLTLTPLSRRLEVVVNRFNSKRFLLL